MLHVPELPEVTFLMQTAYHVEANNIHTPMCAVNICFTDYKYFWLRMSMPKLYAGIFWRLNKWLDSEILSPYFLPEVALIE